MARWSQNTHGGDTEDAHTIVLSNVEIAGAVEGCKRTSRGSQKAFINSKQKGKIACKRANRNKNMSVRGHLQHKYTQARKAKSYHILRDENLSLRKIKVQRYLRTAQINDCKKIREKRSSQAELAAPPPNLTPNKLIPVPWTISQPSQPP